MLFKVRRHDGGSAFYRSRSWFHVLGEQIQERRFARAIGSDNANAVARAKLEIHLTQYLASVAVGKRDIVRLDHRGAQSRHRHTEIERADAGRRLRTTVEQTLRGVDPCLRLRGTGLDASTQPGQLGSREVSTCLFGRGCLLFTFGLRLEQTRVPTRVDVRRAAVDLDHSCRDLVEKESVVAHQDDGAAEINDLLLQPLNGAQVQVVSGFVEDEHIILLGKESGQSYALELPSR